MIVSAHFEGIKNYKRPGVSYRHWDYEGLPVPEFICIAPNEFEEKRKERPRIVRTALEEV